MVDNLMASITLNLPGVPDKVITVPNANLGDISPSYGVNPAGYDTEEEAVLALQSQMVELIKRPYQKYRDRQRAQADISDVMTVTTVT
jgi:hypothetical protein